MRHSPLIILTMCLTLSSANTTAAGQLSFGPLGGGNLANLVDSPQGYSSRAGLNGGILLGGQISRLFGVQGEVYYSQKGAKGEEEPAQIDTIAKSIRLNYVELPLLFRAQTPGETARMFAVLGPAIAFTLSCDIDVFTASGDVYRGSECDEEEHVIEKTDLSWVFGLGFDIRQDGKKFGEQGQSITVDLRYLPGWNGIGRAGPEVLSRAKNKVYALTVRYPIGK